MNNPTPYKDDSSLELPAATSLENLEAPLPIQPSSLSPKKKLPPIIIIVIVSLVVVALIGAGVYSAATKKPTKKTTATQITINTQSLDAGTLTKLTKQAGDTKTKQELVISPDTVFENTVVVHDTVKTDKGLAVTGALDVGSSTNLQGSVVIGGNLAVRGTLSVAGTLSADSLNVGALAITNLTASGSLNFGGHLIPTGAEPTVDTAIAAAGGSVTVSGNDTAGTITITTGSGALLAGEMAVLHFHSGYKTVPKVQLTPVNVSAATMSYYATRSPGFFTVDIAAAPAANTSYVFDYLISE
jgi:hypothetical protein